MATPSARSASSDRGKHLFGAKLFLLSFPALGIVGLLVHWQYTQPRQRPLSELLELSPHLWEHIFHCFRVRKLERFSSLAFGGASGAGVGLSALLDRLPTGLCYPRFPRRSRVEVGIDVTAHSMVEGTPAVINLKEHDAIGFLFSQTVTFAPSSRACSTNCRSRASSSGVRSASGGRSPSTPSGTFVTPCSTLSTIG